MEIEKFRALLNDQYTWPDYYTFKFVVKADNRAVLNEVLAGHNITVKASKNGNYVSITSRYLAKSADEIVEIYRKVAKIDGVMSL
ncbi:MAG: DUF493 domain-containing protein [Bacteriovoracaceae bacterium]|jgi:putative lipoic acid-binding regulatory protein|nr:DUF493 domain-containing protein [Bacteriovoracaceae bacterium]